MRLEYKIAIVGLGSIGKRHLINLDKILTNRDAIYTIDLIRRDANREFDVKYKSIINNIYTETEEIPEDYDVIFVANPTNLHYETIDKYAGKTRHMFIEKPIFDRIDINFDELSLNNDGVYYVACPLRYTEVIQYIRNQIDIEKVYSVRVISSSYLPDWRPKTDYRETYSAHKNQGGGVSIDLIHELDYIKYLFGKPQQVLNLRGKFSALEIDSDDLSVYIIKYDNLLVELHLDYFGKSPIRELQLFTASETIVADLIKSEIRFLRENKIISFNEDRNAYHLKELDYFFDVIERKYDNLNDIFNAYNTLKIAIEGIL